MTDQDYGARTRDWAVLVRAARLGKVLKTVALALATYADPDGRRIFPGNARLAVECEVSYGSVKTALATLRKVGLIESVGRRMAAGGRAEEYRLIIGPDVLEHIRVLSPDEIHAAADKIQEARRGAYDPDSQRRLRSARRTAADDPDAVFDEGLRTAGDTAADFPQPVDNPGLRYAADTAAPDYVDEAAVRFGDGCGTSHDPAAVRPMTPTNTRPIHVPKDQVGDDRSNVTARAREPSWNDPTPILPMPILNVELTMSTPDPPAPPEAKIIPFPERNAS